MKNRYPFVAAILLSACVYGQQNESPNAIYKDLEIVNASGGDALSSNGSVAYSLGTIFYVTIGTANIDVYQGVQLAEVVPKETEPLPQENSSPEEVHSEPVEAVETESPEQDSPELAQPGENSEEATSSIDEESGTTEPIPEGDTEIPEEEIQPQEARTDSEQGREQPELPNNEPTSETENIEPQEQESVIQEDNLEEETPPFAEEPSTTEQIPLEDTELREEEIPQQEAFAFEQLGEEEQSLPSTEPTTETEIPELAPPASVAQVDSSDQRTAPVVEHSSATEQMPEEDMESLEEDISQQEASVFEQQDVEIQELPNTETNMQTETPELVPSITTPQEDSSDQETDPIVEEQATTEQILELDEEFEQQETLEHMGNTDVDQSVENQEILSQESASPEDLSEQEPWGVEETSIQEEEVDLEQSGELGNNQEEIIDAEGNIPNPNFVREENSKGGELEVLTYPNPVIEDFSIYIKNIENEHARYQLFDARGRQLESNKITGKTTKIRIAHLSAATYLLWVFVSNQPIKTFKIIKK